MTQTISGVQEIFDWNDGHASCDLQKAFQNCQYKTNNSQYLYSTKYKFTIVSRIQNIFHRFYINIFRLVTTCIIPLSTLLFFYINIYLGIKWVAEKQLPTQKLKKHKFSSNYFWFKQQIYNNKNSKLFGEKNLIQVYWNWRDIFHTIKM